MKERKIYCCLTTACCAAILAASAVWSQDEAASDVSVALDLSYFSKYVWRGIPVTSESVFQPSLTLAHSSRASLNIWGNMDLTDVNGSAGEFSEIDYTLDYSWPSGPVALSTGVVHYAFPNTSFPSTTEVYLSAGFDAPLSPSAAIYYDFDEVEGFYISLCASQSLPLPLGEGGSTALDLSANVGFGSSRFNSFYYGADKAAFTDLLLSACLPLRLSDKASITPSINYTRILNEELRDSFDASGLKTDNFYAGLTFSCAF